MFVHFKKRREGSKQSESLVRIQIAENQNLGMPNPNRHSNLIYIFTVLCEIVNIRADVLNINRVIMIFKRFYQSYKKEGQTEEKR